jgi:thiamine-monophosphate kinase
MSSLSDVGEFGLIQRFMPFFDSHADVLVGPGDDCAVFRSGETCWLVSSDAFVERVHFRRDWSTFDQIGFKAAAVALSDIAAMGGVPKFLIVSLAIPSESTPEDLELLYIGIHRAAVRADAVIIGGDTSRSATDLMIDITVLGESIPNRYLTRKGAKPGDFFLVTGSPGRSAAGLTALKKGLDLPELIEAHHTPPARYAEGQWLAQQESVKALIDISDGVVQDGGRIAEASGVGLAFTAASVAMDPALMDVSMETGDSVPDIVFYGGEDYELGAAIAPDNCGELMKAFEKEFGYRAFILGEFTEADTGILVDGHPPEFTGHDHFKST